MLDVVYICRNGDNEELRYSIRSVVKNLPHARIWVVGGKPAWYTGKYIKVQQSKSKFQNAKANIVAITKSTEISDNFILMNDDFFIVSPVDEVKYYHAGSLQRKLDYFLSTHPGSQYTALLQKSMNVLQRMGIKDPLDYALHVPMMMNKERLKEILPLGISWRLAYGNIYSVGGEFIDSTENKTRDVKMYIRDNKLTDVSGNPLSKIYLSTDDASFVQLEKMFKEMFPDRSAYER